MTAAPEVTTIVTASNVIGSRPPRPAISARQVAAIWAKSAALLVATALLIASLTVADLTVATPAQAQVGAHQMHGHGGNGNHHHSP
jgi:hypothetical protein